MPTVKLNISLNADVARTLRRRAEELRKPASHYLTDLIREDVRRHQDELAAEGYRLLSADTASFAAAALPLAAEVRPEWEGKGQDAQPGVVAPEENGGAQKAQTEPR
jgi:hypothetical protein